MKKLLLVLLFSVIALCSTAQLPIEFSIQGRASTVNGSLGAELQVNNFAVSESCRPMFEDVSSAITAFTLYLKENYLKSQPYFTLGYSSLDCAYKDYKYINIRDMKFYPAIFLLVGYRTIAYEVSPRLSGKAGLGFIFGHYSRLTFELSINYVLFKNKKNDSK